MTRRADWLLGQLPMGMLDDEFFVRFVSLFQEVASSLLAGVDNVENVVDRTVAPPEFVRWLGSWLGVTSIDASLEEPLQRHLVGEAGQVLAWRGTRRGLERFLTAVTGGAPEIEESGAILTDLAGVDRPGEPRPHTVSIRVASAGWLSDEDFVALVADELPIDVSFELSVGDRRLHPVPVDASSAA